MKILPCISTQLWFFFLRFWKKKSPIEFKILIVRFSSRSSGVEFGKVERCLVDQAKSIDRFLMATEQQDSRLCLASILEDFIKQRNIQVSVDVDSSSKNADETCTSPVLSFFSSFDFLKLGFVIDHRIWDASCLCLFAYDLVYFCHSRA